MIAVFCTNLLFVVIVPQLGRTFPCAEITIARQGSVRILDVERWIFASVRVVPPDFPSNSSYSYTSPVWSPDGKHIAAIEYLYPDLIGRIILINLDNENSKNISENYPPEIALHNISWSPDSQKIVYSIRHAGNQDQIFITNLEGKILYHIHSHYVTDIKWSPNSNEIAFVGDGLPFIWNLNGKIIQLVEPHELIHAYELDWSPDGKQIVFTWIDGINIINKEGTNLHTVFDQSMMGNIGAVWSPEGNKFAFTGVVTHPSYQRDIYIVSSDGTNIINITNNNDTYYSPIWSPNGRWLLFEVERGSHGTWSYVINVEGKYKYRIESANNADFSWNPTCR
jgi:TolB protein